MIEKVKKYITENKLIPSGSRVLLAVSGGKDSVFMFHILNRLKKELGFEIACAHVNHMLRGKDSDDDEEFVKSLCRKSDVEFFVLKKDIRKYAADEKLSEEEAGRKVRYDFFEEIVNRQNMDITATAHNFDDQAETVLINILRGTGTQGLTGIKNTQKVIRPVLCVTKEEITGYLEENAISYRNDRTNDEEVYQRNKIRMGLIPYLKKNYNENITMILNRLSENMRDDYEIISEYIKIKFHESAVVYSDRIEIDIKILNKMKKAVAARIIMEAFCRLDKIYNLEKKHTEIILDLARTEKTGKTLDIHGKMTAQIVYGKLIIKEKNENISEFSYILEPGKKVFIEETGTWINTFISENKNHIDNGSMRICIDLKQIEGPLTVRNRKEGDRFVPAGMTGTKKLKDFFIDEKIPREQRDAVPVIECKKGIIWIAGYRMSEEFKADESTKKILIMEMEK